MQASRNVPSPSPLDAAPAARHALVLDDDPRLRSRAVAALVAQGFDVLSTARLEEARSRAREGGLDLLVMGERAEGRLTHSLALLAEWRSPLVATLILSDRQERDLLDLLPSVRAVLPRGVEGATLARLAAALPREAPRDRLRHRWEAAGGDDQPEHAGEPAAEAAAPPPRRDQAAALPGFLTRRTMDPQPSARGAVPAPPALLRCPPPRRLRLALDLEAFPAPSAPLAPVRRRLHLA